jgi:hypothetical protein
MYYVLSNFTQFDEKFAYQLTKLTREFIQALFKIKLSKQEEYSGLWKNTGCVQKVVNAAGPILRSA